MTKVCAKIIPKLITNDQKEKCLKNYAEILKQIEENPKFLNSVIT